MGNTLNKSALLWAYQVNHGKSTSIEASEISIKHSADGYQWIHLRCDDQEAKNTLSTCGIEENVIEALTADQTRPRTTSLNQGVLSILRGINNNPNADPEDMISLRIWFDGKFIVTSRMQGRRLAFVETLKDKFEQNVPPETIGAFMATLMEFMVNDISVIIESIESTIETFEAEVITTTHLDRRNEIVQLRRQVAAIRRHLAPQREAIDGFNRVQLGFTEQDTFSIKQQSDRTFRHLEDLDLARERAVFLQEEFRHFVSEQQSERMYFLSIIAAIFLPLSFITGIFGMNVGGLPGLDNPNGFLYLLTGMSALAAIILIIIFIRRWL